MNNEENQTQEIEETREMLEGYLDQFTRSMRYNIDRADRIEALMQRRSAQKWNAKKKQKMVRRLVNARTTAGQLEPIIDQVQVRLRQISKA